MLVMADCMLEKIGRFAAARSFGKVMTRMPLYRAVRTLLKLLTKLNPTSRKLAIVRTKYNYY